jgi:hypothetical protein
MEMLYRYKLGKRGIDIVGVEIYKALSEVPQTLDDLTEKVYRKFSGKDRNLLKSEIESFCRGMEEEGLIVSGKDDAELNHKDLADQSSTAGNSIPSSAVTPT